MGLYLKRRISLYRGADNNGGTQNQTTYSDKNPRLYLGIGVTYHDAPAANLIHFVYIIKLSRNEPPKGFALSRHGLCCMTIFYPEVR